MHGRLRSTPRKRTRQAPADGPGPGSTPAGHIVDALQGEWMDDIGLSIRIQGRRAEFSDGSGSWAIEEADGTVTLRGAELVGTPVAPLWRFPWGVERRWARPSVEKSRDEAWAERFLRHKGLRAELWQELCGACDAGGDPCSDARVAQLQQLWRSGSPLPDGDKISAEERECLVSGQLLVPGVCFLHRKFGYRGVILGCEPTCTAPASWRAQMGVPLLPGGAGQPFYHCAVDERDRPGGQVTFVAQENLVPEFSARAFPIISGLADTFLVRCDRLWGYRPGPKLQEALWKQRAGGGPFML